ncbi:inositol monophosphatase [Agrobacterium tumefaciens]|jgi:histidinol phosphatase-like enzyme (inositol monophosphatase family)|uniref:Histidinol-phosphatase n=1 Tax=Agrobacterium fabrum (strain C58 / ATCC 33970) TaxID=176299 RepID=Q7CTJ2_AGRFC|nr:histidinol-phosphatase [Agrobacterium fabrum]KEY54418.1 inositol monophosphatase [Agrobacterium tumefaciens]AAK89535.2 inositol monophosphatase family protein [Agrobacterium fabrum str. C58]AYM59660.1 inositol monophosphatase [Agrobacterium fabrum]KJX86415.1 Inositol-1-monophosphatase IMPase [Agrobacterium tumefaciens]MCX2875872.1 histidinol-phosphatase [Agrobacterium fabrum]
MLPDRDFFFKLADAASAETLPRFRTGIAVINKQDGGYDPVTEGDQAAETAIRALIEERFPQHGILGEEHGNVGLDRDHIWVIDPIDGTRAFISGVPVWGTLIGFQSSGRATMGIMDQPFTKERYFADGKAAWYFGPDGEKKIRTRDCASLSDAVLFTTTPHIFTAEEKPLYEKVQDQVRLFRYGVDCYAYCLLAAGHVDLVIESGLKPYDVGALIPVIEQAGGTMTTWDGGRPENGGRILAAGSKAVHEEALAILSKL